MIAQQSIDELVQAYSSIYQSMCQQTHPPIGKTEVVISPESGIVVIVLEGWYVVFQPLDELTIMEK